jgi:hypothetical protein
LFCGGSLGRVCRATSGGIHSSEYGRSLPVTTLGRARTERQPQPQQAQRRRFALEQSFGTAKNEWMSVGHSQLHAHTAGFAPPTAGFAPPTPPVARPRASCVVARHTALHEAEVAVRVRALERPAADALTRGRNVPSGIEQLATLLGTRDEAEHVEACACANVRRNRPQKLLPNRPRLP